MNSLVSALSASRLVFVLIAVGATVGLFTGHISENNFMLLATGAFSFYFSKPPTTSGGGSGGETVTMSK